MDRDQEQQPRIDYATPASYEHGTARLPNPMARASLVFGILFFVLMAVTYAVLAAGVRARELSFTIVGVSFICPVMAIVFGVIALVKTKRGFAGRGSAITGIVLGGVSVLLFEYSGGIDVLFPPLGRSTETANRVKCASCMRQIGQAILLYSNENRGLYPPRLEDLLLTQDITAEVFVCASSNDTRSPGSTPQQQAAGLTGQPGHLSFVYVGQKMNSTIGADVVVMYEPLTNHNQAGSNMLFGDGRVEWIEAKQAGKIIAEVQAGQNPPPSYRGGF